MQKLAVALLLSLAPITAVQAQNMPLNQFLNKATSLEKKGPLALLSGDLKVLKKEMQNSGKELRAERLAAAAAGKKPAFCPPENGASVNSSELLSHFRSIPQAQRDRMRTKDAFRSFMARKYPCLA